MPIGLVGWLIFLVGASTLYAATQNESVIGVISDAINPKSGAKRTLGDAVQGGGGGGAIARPAGYATGSVQAVIAYAQAQIGKPYRWAAAGPNAFDCSGLTMMAYRAAGIHLPHNSAAQYAATARYRVTDVQPGDLVFFRSAGVIHHVGLAIGGGMMIEAPHTNDEVKIYSIAAEGDFFAATRPLAGGASPVGTVTV